MTGVLYVVPPFSLHWRVGGEIVLWEGLAMLPILGAYLVQVGESHARKTMVMLFGPRVSGRFIVPALSVLFYASLVVPVGSAIAG